ncbi:DMT family transporter [uncultured Thermanaerothrix sp.]|uniref:DMT family transporter n=1 Tax=uncultured Thermanaerothrix sp. TaxID=1195149 RepID=UPI0026205BFA|nr:DMT family transporter [uncultured Thermanaerothrix sp.]
MAVFTLGALAALTAALLWACASFLFAQSGRWLRPLHLNLFKGIIGLFLLGLTLLCMPNPPTSPSPQAMLWLGLSGLIGISLGDTAYLATLNDLGPRRTLLLTILAPPITALLGWITLGESLSPPAWAGILITSGGVAWVISERTPAERQAGPPHWRGVLWGLLAALAQSSAVLLSRAVFLTTSINALQSAVIRLAAGVVGLLLWIGLTHQSWPDITPFRAYPRLLVMTVGATFLGTYLAMWLQQVALTYAAAGVVQTLLATSPVFILPLAAWNGERLSLRAVAGAGVALTGIWLLFWPT